MRTGVTSALRLALLVAATGTAAAVPPPAAVERVARDTIAFPATVTAEGFARRLVGTPGYHLIVWADGGAASAALFQAAVSDTAVLDALETLGGKPGDALGVESWDKRHDAHDHAADAVIAGPAVEIRVRVPGRGVPLALADILDDPGGRGFDMRLGGHRANIPRWHSGCVVCLYSCPGSKVGNARYTVRDYARGTTSFRVRPGALPADGTTVTIEMRLVPSPSAGGATAGGAREPSRPG